MLANTYTLTLAQIIGIFCLGVSAGLVAEIIFDCIQLLFKKVFGKKKKEKLSLDKQPEYSEVCLTDNLSEELSEEELTLDNQPEYSEIFLNGNLSEELSQEELTFFSQLFNDEVGSVLSKESTNAQGDAADTIEITQKQETTEEKCEEGQSKGDESEEEIMEETTDEEDMLDINSTFGLPEFKNQYFWFKPRKVFVNDEEALGDYVFCKADDKITVDLEVNFDLSSKYKLEIFDCFNAQADFFEDVVYNIPTNKSDYITVSMTSAGTNCIIKKNNLFKARIVESEQCSLRTTA